MIVRYKAKRRGHDTYLTIAHTVGSNYHGYGDDQDEADRACLSHIGRVWNVNHHRRLVDVVQDPLAITIADLPPVRVTQAEFDAIYESI